MSEEWRRRFLDTLDEYVTNLTGDLITQRRLDRRQELRTSLFHMLGEITSSQDQGEKK